MSWMFAYVRIVNVLIVIALVLIGIVYGAPFLYWAAMIWVLAVFARASSRRRERNSLPQERTSDPFQFRT